MVKSKPRRNKAHSPPRHPRGQAPAAPNPRSAPTNPRNARGGPKAGLWIYGRHPVLAALANPARRCHRLLVGAQESRSLGAAIKTHLAARGGGPRPEVVERRDLADLLGKEALHQGLALQVDPLPTLPIEALLEQPDGANTAGANTPGAGASIVALDQVTDPRNVGAIFRSAAAFGARAVLLSTRHAPPETGVLARAASGGLELVPRIEVTNLARALERLKSAGWWTLGLAQDAPRDLTGSMTGERIVLVLGAEGKGLRRLTRETCDILARLPTDPEMPSLNVSNAAAVALFALAAQRPDRT